MATQYANLIAIFLYAIASVYLFRKVLRQETPERNLLLGLAPLILIAHGVGVYGLSIHQHGFQLGFFAVSSLIFWVINLIVLLSSLKKPLHNLFIMLFPLSAVSVAASMIGHTDKPDTMLSFTLAGHVLLSILAYSLLTIATLQALLLAYQNHQLKHRQAAGIIRLLPPLQTMESLLFELLWGGQIILTLSILTGIVFLDDIFAQRLAHKTVFSILAWVIYAVLLWGRHALGWRGYTAIRWTLVGFSMLMLAYFGSKLVLEILLQRL
jgi:ABC-type uncharacterized transport system permease subunit